MTSKVNFTLKKKKKTPPSSTTPNLSFNEVEVADVAAEASENRQNGTCAPLTIPLPPQPSPEPVNEEDSEAIQALIQSTETDQKSLARNRKYLIIPKLKKGDNDDDETLFRNDISGRAVDISEKSEVYLHVPIVEFGAAMLRGMGWKGDDAAKKKDEEDEEIKKPRHWRLGLGAVPKIDLVKEANDEKDGKMKRHWTVSSKRNVLKNTKELVNGKPKNGKDEKVEKEHLQDRIQVGSIVKLYLNEIKGVKQESSKDEKPKQRRAKIVQTLGVPGLNQILIQLEDGTVQEEEKKIISVTKGILVLDSVEEVDKYPWKEAEVKPKIPNPTQGTQSKNHEVQPSRREKSDPDKYNHRKEGDRDNYRDYKQSDLDKKRKQHGHDYNDDYQKSKRRRDERSTDQKYREGDSKSSNHQQNREQSFSKHSSSKKESKTWLIPNILVRIISKSSRYYKQKAMVLDVTKANCATLSLASSNKIVEHVKERHLETALPKIRDRTKQVIILKPGELYRQKGCLMDKNDDKSKGTVQIVEDLSFVELNLDYIAQWCGPLEE